MNKISKKACTFSLDINLVLMINAKCKERGITKSRFMNDLLSNYFLVESLTDVSVNINEEN